MELEDWVAFPVALLAIVVPFTMVVPLEEAVALGARVVLGAEVEVAEVPVEVDWEATERRRVNCVGGTVREGVAAPERWSVLG